MVDKEEFKITPVHLRTIKLFRWHIAKQTKCSIEELIDVMEEFHVKYDVVGDDFKYPILLALTGDIKERYLIELIYTLGKEKVIELLDEFLKTNKK